MNETALQLRDRVGAKPETGPTIPHLQHSDISPPEIRDQLRDWACTVFEASYRYATTGA